MNILPLYMWNIHEFSVNHQWKKWKKGLNIILIVFFSQQEVGDEKCIQTVQKLMPQKVKKRRKIQTEDGVGRSFLPLFMVSGT